MHSYGFCTFAKSTHTMVVAPAQPTYAKSLRVFTPVSEEACAENNKKNNRRRRSGAHNHEHVEAPTPRRLTACAVGSRGEKLADAELPVAVDVCGDRRCM